MGLLRSPVAAPATPKLSRDVTEDLFDVTLPAVAVTPRRAASVTAAAQTPNPAGDNGINAAASYALHLRIQDSLQHVAASPSSKMNAPAPFASSNKMLRSPPAGRQRDVMALNTDATVAHDQAVNAILQDALADAPGLASAAPIIQTMDALASRDNVAPMANVNGLQPDGRSLTFPPSPTISVVREASSLLPAAVTREAPRQPPLQARTSPTATAQKHRQVIDGLENRLRDAETRYRLSDAAKQALERQLDELTVAYNAQTAEAQLQATRLDEVQDFLNQAEDIINQHDVLSASNAELQEQRVADLAEIALLQQQRKAGKCKERKLRNELACRRQEEIWKELSVDQVKDGKMRMELLGLQADIVELERALAVMKADRDCSKALRLDVKAANAEQDKLLDKYRRLKQAKEEAQADSDDALKQQERKHIAAQAELRELQKTLQGDIVNYQHENRDLHQQIGRLRQQMQEMADNHSHNDAEMELEEAQTKVARLEKQVAKLEKGKDKLQVENERLQASLDAQTGALARSIESEKALRKEREAEALEEERRHREAAEMQERAQRAFASTSKSIPKTSVPDSPKAKKRKKAMVARAANNEGDEEEPQGLRNSALRGDTPPVLVTAKIKPDYRPAVVQPSKRKTREADATDESGMEAEQAESRGKPKKKSKVDQAASGASPSKARKKSRREAIDIVSDVEADGHNVHEGHQDEVMHVEESQARKGKKKATTAKASKKASKTVEVDIEVDDEQSDSPPPTKIARSFSSTGAMPGTSAHPNKTEKSAQSPKATKADTSSKKVVLHKGSKAFAWPGLSATGGNQKQPSRSGILGLPDVLSPIKQ